MATNAYLFKEVRTTQLQVPLPIPKVVVHGLRSGRTLRGDRGAGRSRTIIGEPKEVPKAQATRKRRIAMEIQVHLSPTSSPIKPNSILSNPIDIILTECLEGTR
jgi:hypothetical protein